MPRLSVSSHPTQLRARDANATLLADNGNRIVYGTDNGVYLSDLRNKNKVPVKVISVPNVTQLDVLEGQGILIVLAGAFLPSSSTPKPPRLRMLLSFRQSRPDLLRRQPRPRRRRRSCEARSQDLFARHLLQGRSVLGSDARLRRQVGIRLEHDQDSRTDRSGPGQEAACDPQVPSRQQRIPPRLQGEELDSIAPGTAADELLFQEFYIPTESSSVHFLKSKLCVGCTKGFEIVDLETLDTQGLLDPADSSLDFVQKRETARPIAIYRIEGEFLLCYDGEFTLPCLPRRTLKPSFPEFAFYVNKNGWRAKSNWIIQWEGFPTSFGQSPPCQALSFPHVLTSRRSPPLPLRPRLRTHLCRSAARRERRPHADHPRQQPPLPLRRHSSLHFLLDAWRILLPPVNVTLRLRQPCRRPPRLAVPFGDDEVGDYSRRRRARLQFTNLPGRGGLRGLRREQFLIGGDAVNESHISRQRARRIALALGRLSSYAVSLALLAFQKPNSFFFFTGFTEGASGGVGAGEEGCCPPE